MDDNSNCYPNNNKFVYPQQLYYKGDPNRVSPYVCNHEHKQPQELLQMLEQQKQHCPQQPSQSRSEPAQIDYSKLTSFLEVDNSFLTPWNWKPEDVDNDNGPNHTKRMMNIQPGSFFSYDVIEMGKQMLKHPEAVRLKQESDKKEAVQNSSKASINNVRNQQA